MKKCIERGERLVLILAFLAVICAAGWSDGAAVSAQEQEVRGRVLFISSYSYTWEVVPLQMEGIREALGTQVVLDYKFMDTKNVDTEEGIRLFYELIRYYLEVTPDYDVVIVGDDAAFNFAMEYREELFPDTPIIFEGVNNVELAVDASRLPNVTGVIESISVKDTIALASRMYPSATQVVGILDDTVTGVGMRAEFYKYDPEFPELTFREINASALPQEELLRQVEQLGEESILLYIMCSEDGDGNAYASGEAVGMLSGAAKIPAFSTVAVGMGSGIIGGEMVSHRQMGFIAGEMAKQILQGTDCASIALVEETPMNYYFDENVMKRFGIRQSALPNGVEIINHEETFLERNRSMIKIAIVVGAILVLLILLLSADNIRRRRANSNIRQINERLRHTARYDSLTQLLNRRVFMDDLKKKIAQKEAFGILLYDMDNFKRINDVYGHNEGDVVLREMASRSAALIDGRFHVYRLAGDEFTAIIADGRKDVVEDYAKALMRALSEPFSVAGGEESLHSSIGLAMWPTDGGSESELIESADKAMYHVKNNGKNGYAFYQTGM